MEENRITIMTIKADVTPLNASRLSYRHVLVTFPFDGNSAEAYSLLAAGYSVETGSVTLSPFISELPGLLLVERELLLTERSSGGWIIQMP